MYAILKDPYLKCWIVWEVHPNYMVDIHHDKTRKACQEFIRKERRNK